jgi:hypothetical protein
MKAGRPDLGGSIMRAKIPWWRRWLGGRSSAPTPERRQHPRYRPPLATSCHLLATVESGPEAVRVRNVSAGGISLVGDRPVEPQSVVLVQLANEEQGVRCQLRVRVVYCLEHPSGEYILGGAFTRQLTATELQALLSPPTARRLHPLRTGSR